MNRSIWIAALFIAVAATCTAAALTVASTGPATIRITDVQTADTFVHRDARHTRPGDVEIVRQLLYNRRVSANPLGRAEIVVRHDDAVHSPVEVGERIHKNYPRDVYVKVFENRRREQARETLRQIDPDEAAKAGIK